MARYEFTNAWFTGSTMTYLEEALAEASPERILELGPLDGAFACYVAEKFASRGDVELHCVDTLFENPEALSPEDTVAISGRLITNLTRATDRYASLELTLHQMSIRDALAAVDRALGGRPFDLLHINLPYSSGGEAAVWQAAVAMTRPGALIIFDQQLANLNGARVRAWSDQQSLDVGSFLSAYPGRFSVRTSHVYHSVVEKN